MRQMACHPDLVIRSKNNAHIFVPEDAGEATVCRLCNDIAEDAIQSKCRHTFDRECIKQYVDTVEEGVNVSCVLSNLSQDLSYFFPACMPSVSLTVDYRFRGTGIRIGRKFET
jgi:DNA repair protein RAD16